MSNRLTRREIKRKDQFVTTVEETLDYSRSHIQLIVGAVVAVIVGVLLVAGIRWYQDSRSEKSNAALAEAMETFSAPIVAEGGTPPEGYKGPTFVDEASRDAAAKEHFQSVIEAYGSSDAGAVARLLLADMAASEGDLETARQGWQAYLDHGGDNMLAMQAHVNLLQLRRESGEAETVASELQDMLRSEPPPLPEDLVLYELGQTLEQLERSDEALPHYRRLMEEFPQSGYASPARLKVNRLGGADPGPTGPNPLSLSLGG